MLFTFYPGMLLPVILYKSCDELSKLLQCKKIILSPARSNFEKKKFIKNKQLINQNISFDLKEMLLKIVIENRQDSHELKIKSQTVLYKKSLS